MAVSGPALADDFNWGAAAVLDEAELSRSATELMTRRSAWVDQGRHGEVLVELTRRSIKHGKERTQILLREMADSEALVELRGDLLAITLEYEAGEWGELEAVTRCWQIPPQGPLHLSECPVMIEQPHIPQSEGERP